MFTKFLEFMTELPQNTTAVSAGLVGIMIGGLCLAAIVKYSAK